MTSPPDPTLATLRASLAAGLAHARAPIEQGHAPVATLTDGVTCCSRCGEAPVVGERADLPVCVSCERDILLDVLLERERELAALRAAQVAVQLERGSLERLDARAIDGLLDLIDSLLDRLTRLRRRIWRERQRRGG